MHTSSAARHTRWVRPGVGACMAMLLLLLSHTASAAYLSMIARVDGVIVDVTPQRVLYTVIEGDMKRMRVLNRDTGSLRTVPDVGEIPVFERLTSRGVIFGFTEDLGTAVFEWSGGEPQIYDATPRGMRVSPLGRQYAIFPTWLQTGGRYLVLRDVLARTSTQVGNGRVQDAADVADNGDVVYAAGPAPYSVYRYRAGQTIQLTQAQAWSHFNPRSDGVNVIYRRQVSAAASQIVLLSEATGEVILREANDAVPLADGDYLPSGGWTAFTRLVDVNGTAVRQVWMRSPQGALSPISSGRVDARIEAVTAGQVMFVSGGYLYLGRPGRAAELVSPFAEGTGAAWLQGIWHVYFGGVLYRVVL